jgi:hypothetical protein
MIDIDELERLAKANQTWVSVDEALSFVEATTPAAILALIAEVRALQEDAVPVGVRVESYSLPDAEIEIVRVKQRSGPDKWKAFHGGCYCLNKAGQWELEPMPSSRDGDFVDRCRFDTAQEAIDAARKEKE